MIYAITQLLGLTSRGPVQEISLLMNDIEIALKDRTITEQEYVSLMEDADRLKQIIVLMGDMELNQKINEAIKGLVELAKVVKL